MCVFSLEDTFGSVRWPASPRRSPRSRQVLKSDEPILVTGKVKPGRMDENDENAKALKELNLADAVPLAKLRAEKTRQMMVELPADTLTDERIDALKAALEKYPGNGDDDAAAQGADALDDRLRLPARFNVTPSDELLADREALRRRRGAAAVTGSYRARRSRAVAASRVLSVAR